MKYLFAMTIAVLAVACSSNKNEKVTRPAAPAALAKPSPSPAPASSTPAAPPASSSVRQEPQPKAENPVDSQPVAPLPPASPATQGPATQPPVEPPAATQPAPPAPSDESALAWKVRDIKLTAVQGLEATATGEVSVFFDSGIFTERFAAFKITDRGQGIYCHNTSTGGLKVGDELKFQKATTRPYQGEVGSTYAEIKIAFADSQAQKTLVFECVTHGTIEVEAFMMNYKNVAVFRGDDGQFPVVDSGKDTQEYYRAVDKKSRSFKVIDAAKLAQTDVNATGEDNSMAFVNGDVIPAKTAQELVTTGKAHQTCQVAKVEGGIKTNLVYQLEGFYDGGQSLATGLALYVNKFKAASGEVIAISCFVSRQAPVEAVFDTFKGVLEFGAQ